MWGQQNTSKCKKVWLFWKILISVEIVMSSFVVAEHNSAQLSFFRNSHFWKSVQKINYPKSLIILENINLSGNCFKSLLLCSPSTTQHNFPFSEIHIFENFCLKNISKFKKVGLFWKILIWVEIVFKVLLCSPSTTQYNSPFFEIHIFENVCSKNISKLKKVRLFWKILIWVEIVLRVFCCARRAQLSTTFLFSKFSFLKISIQKNIWQKFFKKYSTAQ